MGVLRDWFAFGLGPFESPPPLELVPHHIASSPIHHSSAFLVTQRHLRKTHGGRILLKAPKSLQRARQFVYMDDLNLDRKFLGFSCS